MKKLLISTTFLLLYFGGYSQSASSTYTLGDIGSDDAGGYNAATTCNGNNTTLVVNIPAGAIVTSVDVVYNMTAPGAGGGWTNEQMSMIHCQETNSNEGAFINGGTVGGTSSAGTISYNRAGLTFANGVSATGIMTFEMRTFRQWTGTVGCNTTVQKVDNNTWTVTVNYNVPVAQTYTSSTVSQGNTSNASLCGSDHEIIGIEVIMNGTLTPLNLTSMRFQTTGCTNPLADISNVDLYYTGTSNAFATGNLFGSSAPAAAGNNFSINGTQTLSNGTNYFWLAFDLTGGATVGNVLDAICNQITINGSNYTPTVTTPAGSRPIGTCNPGPGGINSGLQGWFDAALGTAGSNPVATWANQASNPSLTQLTSTSGTTVVSGAEYNFNSGIDLDGGYNGTFHGIVSNRTDIISGNEVTMFVVTRGGTDLSFNFYSTTSSANQWRTYGFRHGGLGSLFGNGTGIGYNAGAVAMTNNIYGMTGTASSSGTNTYNGFQNTIANVNAFTSQADNFDLSVGWWPGYGTGQIVSEAIIWDVSMNAIDFHKIETYCAIKYGLTLGTNGTTMDYNSSDNSIIWDQSANIGYNTDIAGIARDDASGLNQMKSHSVNGAGSPVVFSDIVTIANGTNFASPSNMATDMCSFVWGHNNAPTLNTGGPVNITTDNGVTIQSIFQRHWKSQETGTVGNMTLEFDLSSVMGAATTVGNNDLANLRLLVDEDGDFTNGATAYSPTSFNNGTDIAYFQHDFTSGTGVGRGFFFTLASTQFNTTPLPVDLLDYQVVPTENQSALNYWLVENEKEIDYYLIEKSVDGLYWEEVGNVERVIDNENQKSYSLEDTHPYFGTSYYRLTEIDLNGEIGAQEIRTFELNDALSVDVYPNPSNGTLNILLAGNLEKIDDIKLVNSIGQIIMLKQNLTSNKIQMNGLSPGLYTVIVTEGSGDRAVRKLVVN